MKKLFLTPLLLLAINVQSPAQESPSPRATTSAQASGLDRPQPQPGRLSPELVSSLLGALVGGIIGVAAGWIGASRTHALSVARAIETETAEKDAVRKMLIVEIDGNLASVLSDAKQTHVDARPDDRSGMEWLALNPCPHWSTTVWSRTMPVAVRALTPDEAAEVQRLYSSLQSLTSARAALEALFRGKGRTTDMSVPYDRSRELTASILNSGNPLISKAPR